MVSYSYNTKINATTGVTPTLAFFGREAATPLELLVKIPRKGFKSAPAYILDLVDRTKRVFHHLEGNQKARHMRNSRGYLGHQNDYEEGDVVMVWAKRNIPGRPGKFQESWIGPFRVVKTGNDVLIQVLPVVPHRRLTQAFTVHIGRVRRWVGDVEQQAIPDNLDFLDRLEDDVYEVGGDGVLPDVNVPVRDAEPEAEMVDLTGPVEPDQLEEDVGGPGGNWRIAPRWRPGPVVKRTRFEPDLDQTMEDLEPAEEPEEADEPVPAEDDYQAPMYEELRSAEARRERPQQDAESPIPGPSGRQKGPRGDFPEPTAPPREDVYSSMPTLPSSGSESTLGGDAMPPPAGPTEPYVRPTRRPPLPTKPASKRKAALHLQENIRAAANRKQARRQGVKRGPVPLTEEQRGKSRRGDADSDSSRMYSDQERGDDRLRSGDELMEDAPTPLTPPTPPAAARSLPDETPPAAAPQMDTGRTTEADVTGPMIVSGSARSVSPPARSRSPPRSRGPEGVTSRLRQFGRRVLRGARSEDEESLSTLMMIKMDEEHGIQMVEPNLQDCLAFILPMLDEVEQLGHAPEEE